MGGNPQRPTPGDRDLSRADWTAQAVPWRTERGINEGRRARRRHRVAQEDMAPGWHAALVMAGWTGSGPACPSSSAALEHSVRQREQRLGAPERRA